MHKRHSCYETKSEGSSIMQSDFIDERNEYLILTIEEYDKAKIDNSSIRLLAREFLEYGESKEGYWTGDKFTKQMEMAVQIYS